jgi:hypothetical protein
MSKYLAASIIGKTCNFMSPTIVMNAIDMTNEMNISFLAVALMSTIG